MEAADMSNVPICRQHILCLKEAKPKEATPKFTFECPKARGNIPFGTPSVTSMALKISLKKTLLNFEY